MEIQLTHNNTSQPLPFFDGDLAKGFDEIPTFEEAFDPISLRKFFQEYDSTNSQSVYSPRKENSLLEDTHSQAAEEHDFLFSPLSQCTTQATPTLSKTDSKPNSTYTFSLNSKDVGAKDAPQGSSGKQHRRGPFIVTKVPHIPSITSPDNKSVEKMQIELQSGETMTTSPPQQPMEVQLINRNLLKISLKREETKFEKLLKDKKIFKIQKDEKPKEATKTTINIKRRASSSKGETGPILKHTKSHSPSAQGSSNTKISFNLNPPQRQNSAFYPSLQNFYNPFEVRPIQPVPNPFVPQDQNGVQIGTDYLYNVQKY